MLADRTLLAAVAWALLVATAIAAEGAMEAEAGDSLSYSRDIRPILSDRCFTCHGPDAAARESDLRLDRVEFATGDRGGYAAIVPFDPAASQAFLRITSEDADLQMPPAGSKRELTPEQVRLIRRWIAEGAEYEEHWAFVRPRTASAARGLGSRLGTEWNRPLCARPVGCEGTWLHRRPPCQRCWCAASIWI